MFMKISNKADVDFQYYKLLGKKCKIYTNKDFFLTGNIFSIDKFFNFLVYNCFMVETTTLMVFVKYSMLHFVRGESILYITNIN